MAHTRRGTGSALRCVAGYNRGLHFSFSFNGCALQTARVLELVVSCFFASLVPFWSGFRL